MRLIAIILLSTFAFSDCNDVDACNYGQEEDCIFSPENECCDGFVMSLQPSWDEGMCFPSEFEYNISTSFASYFFNDVYIDDFHIENNDWVAVFNGDVCVGAQQWNIEECGGQICNVLTYGNDGELYSSGYMQTGQIPTFKIYDASENIYYNAIASEECPWNYYGICFVDSLNGFSDYQTSGCTDPNAITCEMYLNAQNECDVSTNIDDCEQNYCYWNNITNSCVEGLWSFSQRFPSCDSCIYNLPCENYYNPNSELDNGLCMYNSYPSYDEFIVTPDSLGIYLDWSLFTPPISSISYVLIRDLDDDGDLVFDNSDMLIYHSDTTNYFYSYEHEYGGVDIYDDFAIRFTLGVAYPNNEWWGSSITNYYFGNISSMLGDLSGDSFINVVDIVMLVGIILNGGEPTDEQLQLGDIYPDGQLNVIDIVALVNIILDN